MKNLLLTLAFLLLTVPAMAKIKYTPVYDQGFAWAVDGVGYQMQVTATSSATPGQRFTMFSLVNPAASTVDLMVDAAFVVAVGGGTDGEGRLELMADNSVTPPSGMTSISPFPCTTWSSAIPATATAFVNYTGLSAIKTNVAFFVSPFLRSLPSSGGFNCRYVLGAGWQLDFRVYTLSGLQSVVLYCRWYELSHD